MTLGVVLFLFAGCDDRLQPALPVVQPRVLAPLGGPVEVTSEQEEGFQDLVFFINEHKVLADNSQALRISGTHRGKAVSLEIVLGPTWKTGSPESKLPIVTFAGAVTYRSVGSESDAFIQTLDEIYGTKVGAKSMVSEARFSAISLQGGPGSLAKGEVRIKLFHDSADENRYAEVFTNIDLASHRLVISEKDEGYRAAIVRALKAP